MRGVVETSEERVVGGREDFGLEDAGLACDERERFLHRSGQLDRARHINVGGSGAAPPDSPHRSSAATSPAKGLRRRSRRSTGKSVA